MLGRGLKVAALLLGVGFLAGFFLSTGSAHFMFRGSPAAAAAPAKSGEEPASADAAGGKGGKHGGMAQEGGQGAGSAAAESARSGDREAAGHEGKIADGEGTDSVAAADEGTPADEAAATMTALLNGNTLQSTREGETLVRYLSAQGWQGEPTQADTLVVHRWLARDGQFCLLMAHQRVTCEPALTTHEAKPAPTRGAVLGTMTLAGVRWTILRGNTADVPESIPLIRGEQAHGTPTLPAKASATGQTAVTAMIGHTLVEGAGRGSPVGARYEPDGRWIRAQPLQPDATTGLDGVRVSIGHWQVSAGLFCLDEPGFDLKRVCYEPEQWGEATFRLRSDRAKKVTTMLDAS